MTHVTLPEQYENQLSDKVARLTQQLAEFSAPEPEVFRSEPQNYRMRAEFRVWHDGDDLYYIMFHPGTRDKFRVDEFPPASKLINTLMPEVLDYVRDKPILRRKLFQVDFLTTTSGEAVISMLYHRQLDSLWENAAVEMRNAFQEFGNINLIGRARKQKVPLHRDRVIERLSINSREFQFEQIENSFTQPNAGVNVQMIEWAIKHNDSADSDLLELYCGNGNFSLPLASQFRKVLGTEISRTSVRSAQTNIELNGIENVVIGRMSAEECAQAIQSSELPGRMKETDLSAYNFGTVLVDPPRAGLDPQTLEMVSQFDRIIYISCNPETLCENLRVLTETHSIENTALFDQFPFTEHTEAGVILQKKT